MEPLLVEQADYNVQCSSGQDSVSLFTRSSLGQGEKHLTNLLVESQKSLQNGLQVPFTSPPSSSENSHSTNRTPPPLTSQDIAALRKTLSGRPKLRRVCQICGRECPSRHKLQRHLSTHSEERPYNCKVCGKAFKWTEYLSKHMRTQHGPGTTTGKY